MKPLDPFTQDTLTAMLAYVTDDARIARHLRIDVERVRSARAAIPRPRADPEPAPAPSPLDIEDDRRHERRAAKLSSDALLAALRRASAPSGDRR